MNIQNYETTKNSDGDIQSTGPNDTLKIDELDHVFGLGNQPEKPMNGQTQFNSCNDNLDSNREVLQNLNLADAQ